MLASEGEEGVDEQKRGLGGTVCLLTLSPERGQYPSSANSTPPVQAPPTCLDLVLCAGQTLNPLPCPLFNLSAAAHPVQAPPTCLDLVLSTDHPETLVTRTYLNVLQLNDEVLVPYFGEVRGEEEC